MQLARGERPQCGAYLDGDEGEHFLEVRVVEQRRREGAQDGEGEAEHLLVESLLVVAGRDQNADHRQREEHQAGEQELAVVHRH